MYQSHTGHLTGLWFLPKLVQGLNTNTNTNTNNNNNNNKMALSRTIHLSGNRKRNSGMVRDGVNEYDGKALCFYCSVFGLCRTHTAWYACQKGNAVPS